MEESTDVARRLRRNSTDTERLIWQRLRGRRLGGFKFRRQRPISGYVVDFVCMERMLVVEIDGGQHEWRAAQDERRTVALEAAGFRVVRFWNNDVMADIDGVLRQLLLVLEAAETQEAPSPSHH